MKKIILTSLFASAYLFSNAQNVNIPDAAFKAALVANASINTNTDTEIQVSEATAYTGSITIHGQGIIDITGIEAFTGLTVLDLNSNAITSMNLTANTALYFLDCGYNSLTSLDVSANTGLIELHCNSNTITSLNLSTNTLLTTVDCGSNNLTSLNVSTNTALTFLHCVWNQITSLNVSANTSLTELSCAYNQIAGSLDVSMIPGLIYLNCQSNKLTSLSIKNGNNTNFTNFWSDTNPFLFCIEVDNATYSNGAVSWYKDAAQTYSDVACPPAPVASFGVNSSTICQGGSIICTDASTNGTAWSWDFNDGNTSTLQNPTNTFSAPGTYTIREIVTNASGPDTAYQVVTVNAPPGLTVSWSGILCNGSCDATATANPTGVGPFTYLWSTSATTAAITGLCAGLFTVDVTDANGCTSSAAQPFTDPVILTVGLTKNDVSCNALCNGNSTATTTGGAGGYSYNWTPGGMTISSPTNLCAGTYTCDVTDVNGCTANSTITITEPTVLTVSTATTNVSCYGAGDGSATLTPAGGFPGYTYFWAQGASTAAITNLGAGTYSYDVYDSHGCQTSGSVTITEPSLITNTFTPVSSTCGSSNGSLTTTVSGGVGPYTYLWADGTTATSLSSIGAGQYFVQVTDATGCVGAFTGNVNDANGPTVSLNSTTNVSCNGLSDGAISTTISGGTPPLAIQWLTGGNTNSLSNIPAGVYDLIVTDNSGCSVYKSYTVTEPAVLSLTGSSVSPSACLNADGSASVAVTGGTTPYVYAWDAAAGSQTTAAASGVAAGAYKVIVADANGCSDSSYVSVEDPGAPQIIVDSIVQAGCVSAGNIGGGGIYVSMSGGSGSFNFAWTNGTTTEDASGLGKGIYGLVVTDISSNCKASVARFVYGIQPGTPQICLVTVDTSNNRNIIIWEKDIPGIKTYKIYRQSSMAGQFNLIATIPADSLSQFEDTLANADVQPWDYEIKVTDSCNFTSSLSIKHQSIFLTASQNVGGNVDLSWTPYAGTIFSNYYIYRKGLLSPWTLIDSVSVPGTTYTDANAPNDSLDYMIEIEPSNPCNPSRSIVNTSRSNIKNQIVNNTTLAVKGNQLESSVNVFPNPMKDIMQVSVKAVKEGQMLISVYDLQGKEVFRSSKNVSVGESTEIIPVKNLADGLYIVQINMDGKTLHKKIMKQ